ncbi:MAG: carboxymuconolactone decarboxylase family protein [Nitrospirota bacterium]
MKLEERIRELIAVGASVTANCQPCLKYHISKALESGAEEHEITEAVRVARMVRKGATAEMDKFISDSCNPDMVSSETAEGCVSGGCGCNA